MLCASGQGLSSTSVKNNDKTNVKEKFQTGLIFLALALVLHGKCRKVNVEFRLLYRRLSIIGRIATLCESVHYFLGNSAYRQTEGQTDRQTNKYDHNHSPPGGG